MMVLDINYSGEDLQTVNESNYCFSRIISEILFPIFLSSQLQKILIKQLADCFKDFIF